jgi:mRNA interferase MazF
VRADTIKLFEKWNTIKQITHFNNKIIGIKERDILFVNMGQNIGYEQDGKGDEFLRPVVVIKKFNKNMFLGIALTTKTKDNKYHFEFSYQNKSGKIIKNSAILSQVKLYDTKRVKYKSGMISIEEFKKMYRLFNELIEPEIVTSSKNEEEPQRDYENDYT